MKIFAHSATTLADTFLHAGYVSATPSGVAMQYPMIHDPQHTGHAVSLADAFSLTTTTVPMDEAAATGLMDVLSNPGPTVPAVLALVVVALAVRWLPRPRWTGAGAAVSAAMVLLLVGGMSCSYPRGYMEVTGFTHPSEMTFVMLNAVARDVLVRHHDDDAPFESIEDLDEHLSIPVDLLDDGMELALGAFPLDVWGNEIVLELQWLDNAMGVPTEPQYLLTSAGPDGVVETDDDITAHVVAQELVPTHDSDYVRRTYYLQRRDNVLWVTTRRAPSSATHQADWDGEDPGEELWPGYQSIPLDPELVATWWGLAYPFEDSLDCSEDVELIEAFYDTFVTPLDPQPMVVQYFDGVNVG